MRLGMKKSMENLTFLQKQEINRLTDSANKLQTEISYFKRAGDTERVNELEEEYQGIIAEINNIKNS
jgi:uncharacterized membrane protein (DUF106 family)